MRHASWILLAALAACLIFAGLGEAGKPDKGGKPDGGGGDSGLSYQIVALDDAGGMVCDGVGEDVNNLGLVVGSVRDAITDSPYAACWILGESNGEVDSTLTLLSGGTGANGVNEDGEIVGEGVEFAGTDVEYLGLYWPAPGAEPVELDPLAGHDVSVPYAINDDGVICGVSAVVGGPWTSRRAVAWRVTWVDGAAEVFGPVELPGGLEGAQGVAITNNDGSGVAEIVGYGWGPNASASEAVVWQVVSGPNGTLTALPLPELLAVDAEAYGINSAGSVCGQVDNEAIVWSPDETTVLERPTKGKNSVALTHALDINDAGLVVGIGGPGIIDSRAVFWGSANAKMVYLDSFLDADSQLAGLSQANAANEHGDIVGEAWNGAFLAVPLP